MRPEDSVEGVIGGSGTLGDLVVAAMGMARSYEEEYGREEEEEWRWGSRGGCHCEGSIGGSSRLGVGW